jgi:hypothetical protein
VPCGPVLRNSEIPQNKKKTPPKTPCWAHSFSGRPVNAFLLTYSVLPREAIIRFFSWPEHGEWKHHHMECRGGTGFVSPPCLLLTSPLSMAAGLTARIRDMKQSNVLRRALPIEDDRAETSSGRDKPTCSRLTSCDMGIIDGSLGAIDRMQAPRRPGLVSLMLSKWI